MKLQFSSKRSGTMEVGFSEEVSVPAGRYTLHLKVPGCKPLPDVELDIKGGGQQNFALKVQTLDGQVKINCNVPDYEVWLHDSWLKVKELTVNSLVNQDIVLRAKGYRTCTMTVKVKPAEVKTVNIVMQPLQEKLDRDSETMRTAEAEYGKKNYAKAWKLYLKAAEQGNRLANYRLGEIYENGQVGFFSNKEKAYRYYHTAASADYPPAFYKLGVFHENGMAGLSKNEETALKWYRKGAELNHIPCLNRIGKYYESGLGGVRPDRNMAVSCYKRGAAANNAESQFNLGNLYEQQMITAETQDQKDHYRRLARQWYEEAASRGNDDARKRMNNL